MKGHSWNHSPGFAFLLALALFVCTVPCVSSVAEASDSEYVYDKMWPLLEQPWYFSLSFCGRYRQARQHLHSGQPQ